MLRRWFALAIVACLWAAPAAAQFTGHGFGLGFQFGDPTGATGKVWLDDTNALQFGAGFRSSFHGKPYGTAWPVGSFDWVHHFGRFGPRSKKVRFRMHVGVGGAAGFMDRGACYYDVFDRKYCSGAAVGAAVLRIPVGFNLYPRSARFEAFIEVAPGLRLSPYFYPVVMGNVGGRYYF